MAGKRPYQNVDAEPPGPVDGGHKIKKRKTKPKASNAKPDNISWVKKRARDIDRMLQRGHLKLPANVQKDLERELAAHRSRIKEDHERKLRSKMIGRYHMVRFFEKKKAMRLEKQLEKRLQSSTDPAEIEALKADLHIVQVDISYAKYFPFMEPYVSIYPAATAESKAEEEASDEKSIARAALRSERPAMWPVIEKAMEEGEEALQRLRDSSAQGRPAAGSSPQPPSGRSAVGARDEKAEQGRQAGSAGAARSGGPSRASGRTTRDYTSRKARAGEAEADASDSEDGGFFEEG